jgi:hypothetical protein
MINSRTPTRRSKIGTDRGVHSEVEAELAVERTDEDEDASASQRGSNSPALSWERVSSEAVGGASA